VSITMIGLDTAKSVFQVHAVDEAGKAMIRRKLYPAHPIIRKSFGLMTRKLSATSSQKMCQFLGTS
jgi:hypothetical protein